MAQRDKINHNLQEILDRQTDPWGVKISNVEIKHVDLPVEMQRAMARQAEAERERRAKVIHAKGEFEASQTLADAAELIGTQSGALQIAFSANYDGNRYGKKTRRFYFRCRWI